MPESAAPPTPILSFVLIYATFASLWILLSDMALGWLLQDPSGAYLASTLKGWLFVLVTSLLLYGLLRRMPGMTHSALPELPRKPLLLLFAAIFTLTAVAMVRSFSDQRDKEVAQLQAIATLKAGQIGDWLRERREDANFVRNSPDIAVSYLRWRRGDTASHDRLLARLKQLGQAHALLLDAQDLGGESMLPPPLRAAARQASTDGQVHDVGPDLDASGKTYLDFIAPLVSAGAHPPLIVMRIDPEDWLYPTLNNWPVPSRSGASQLFRRDGDQIEFLKRPHRGPARLPLSSKKLLSAQLLRGEVRLGSLVQGLDDRGVPAMGVIQAVPGSDWFLVAKLDRVEIDGETFQGLAWIGLAGFLASFVAGTGAYLLRLRQQTELASEVEQTQAERLRALRLLAAIADSSDDAIFAKDLEGRYLLFNRAAGQLLGGQDLLGRCDTELFPVDQAEKLLTEDRRVIDEGRNHTREEIFSLGDGERTLLTTKGPLRDETDKIIGVFGIARDISERKRAEESLYLWAQTFEHAQFGLAIADAGRDTFVVVNPAFARERGYRPEELAGKPVMTVYAAETAKAAWAQIRALEPSGHGVFESEHVCKDGRRFPVLLDITIVKSDDGQPTNRIVYALDISERRAAEATLQRQSEELARRNQELERFNRATVGRELDMIALKRRINELSIRLGEAPPYDLSFLEGGQP